MKQRGFTLVEMTVVLLVVGILIAAVFKGQAMIYTSRARAIIKDMNTVALATSMYFDRYKYLPGDDPNAGTRWPGVVSGNGDRQLSGAYNANPSNPPTSNEEANLFWWHLRAAGFLIGDLASPGGAMQPVSAIRSHLGVQDGSFVLGGMMGPILCTDVTDRVAIEIDNQMDDANPKSGVIRAIAGDWRTQLTSTPVAQYDENANNYVVCGLLSAVGSK